MVTQQQLVKTRPIILRPHEVRGILDGTVTQLWRAMKRQPGSPGCLMNTPIGGLSYVWPHEQEPGVWVEYFCECPWGKAGSRIWGREGWRADWTPACGHGVRYAADEQFICRNNPDQEGYQWLVAHYGGNNHTEPQRSSATMPRWASRILLEIEAVSALPVQGVTLADIEAMGIPGNPMQQMSYRNDGYQRIEDFKFQWDRDNPRHLYASNPYAWRLTVRRVAS